MNNPFFRNIGMWIVIFFIVIMGYRLMNSQQTVRTAKNYSEFIAMVDAGHVQDATIQGQTIIFTDRSSQKKYNVYVPNDPNLIGDLRAKNVNITAMPPENNPWYMTVLVSWLPMLFLIGIWIFFMRQMQGGGGKAMSFGKSKAKLMTEHTQRVTFHDVAGIDEAKEELTEVVEFLREPHKFTRLGGRIPKGVLLTGPPGTGKTLLARAIAGEAGVPFFSISGSDFVEMFVGVGASRVRDLFMQGKKNAPCIIFIDEIDAVGRHRGAGLGGGHDEREQTLNQLLVEMDGFESNEGVIMISATNRPDVLDPALLRPGRFDRQVVVSLPDLKGREMILAVHMRKTPLANDVDVVALAKGTPGFSGADLENLVNEAALLAAKRNKKELEMRDFEDAKDKVYMGLERKSKVVREEDRKLTAYHEGGHALVARLLPETNAVNKVSIIPRGNAGGVTWFFPEERDFRFKDQLENELAMAFGGRVAEELVFGRISTGASADIKHATSIINKMVRNWGMGKKLGPLSYQQGEEQVFLGREIGHGRDYSEETARTIDMEITEIANAAYALAKKTLEENLDILHKLAELLLEKETIMGKELDALILSMRPGIQLFEYFDPEKAFKDAEKRKKAKKEKKQNADNDDNGDDDDSPDIDPEEARKKAEERTRQARKQGYDIGPDLSGYGRSSGDKADQKSGANTETKESS